MGKVSSKQNILMNDKQASGQSGSSDSKLKSLIPLPSPLMSHVAAQSESIQVDSTTVSENAIAELTYTPDQQKKTKKVPRDTVHELTGLTVRQCKAVQESWKNFTSTNINECGIQFFMRFFLNYPEYRYFYPDFRSDSDVNKKTVNRQELRKLRHTPQMHDLAAAYMEALTTIFNKVENIRELTEILENLTDRHLPRGVLSLHFQDMMSTLLLFMEEKMGHSNMTTSTRDSWTCVLRTIITIIDQRYLELQHKQFIRRP